MHLVNCMQTTPTCVISIGKANLMHLEISKNRHIISQQLFDRHKIWRTLAVRNVSAVKHCIVPSETSAPVMRSFVKFLWPLVIILDSVWKGGAYSPEINSARRFVLVTSCWAYIDPAVNAWTLQMLPDTTFLNVCLYIHRAKTTHRWQTCWTAT